MVACRETILESPVGRGTHQQQAAAEHGAQGQPGHCGCDPCPLVKASPVSNTETSAKDVWWAL